MSAWKHPPRKREPRINGWFWIILSAVVSLVAMFMAVAFGG